MLEKNYTPKDFEEKIYEKWEVNGDFKPDMRSDKDAFCVVIIIVHLRPERIFGLLAEFVFCFFLFAFKFKVGTAHVIHESWQSALSCGTECTAAAIVYFDRMGKQRTTVTLTGK